MKARLRKKIGAGTVDAKGRTVYIASTRVRGREKVRRAVCRVEAYAAQVEADQGDPIMDASGCLGDFVDEWKRKDRRDGCPACLGHFFESAKPGGGR